MDLLRQLLGYDLPRGKIQELLLAAAADAELEEPFVQIAELGDFAVTYRVAGLLREVKELLTARSRLRRKVMDRLHGARVEIVSPSFMNTRAVAEGRQFIPPLEAAQAPESEEPKAEEVAFDKAEDAESRAQAEAAAGEPAAPPPDAGSGERD